MLGHRHTWGEPNLNGLSLKTGTYLITNARRKCVKCGRFQRIAISYVPNWRWLHTIYSNLGWWEKAYKLGTHSEVKWEDVGGFEI